MEGPTLGPGGEDITWPDQVAPRGRKASSTRKIKPQTSNLKPLSFSAQALLFFMDNAMNEALRALNSASLQRYTDLQCPKARRRRLKAV